MSYKKIRTTRPTLAAKIEPNSRCGLSGSDVSRMVAARVMLTWESW